MLCGAASMATILPGKQHAIEVVVVVDVVIIIRGVSCSAKGLIQLEEKDR